ncbi:MAG: DNA-3-methyladenine glycosylase [Bacteroidia bacterium]|nr:DNA-3-methyladenine glycosylase [Bacteroidia bacterium]
MLPAQYYLHADVVWLARNLLGKTLCTFIDGKLTKAKIVETEAYEGVTDRASHSFGGRLTPRTKTMYQEGGIAYVYFCYGMHYLFNVVTNIENIPHAVLIRGIEPLEGIETMLERRGFETVKPELSNGPGKLSKALGINKQINGMSLFSDIVWIEDAPTIDDSDITASPRVGVAYALDHAEWPYRFRVKGNLYAGK